MSRETARTAITAVIEARKSSWSDPNLIVEYDNRSLVNRAAATAPFLEVQINYIDGVQASLWPNPIHRVYGHIILTARIREDEGVSVANQLLENFFPYLQMTDQIGPLRTTAAKFAKAKTERGWAGEAAVIPFWYDNPV